MNWGNKIILVLVVFVLGIGSMVYICMRQTDIHLVAKDYYEQEINYQQTIDKEKNYDELANKPMISDDVQNQCIKINFSQVVNNTDISGKVYFFRPSGSSLDFRADIDLDEDKILKIDKRVLAPGKWIIKMDWSDAIRDYYHEQTFFVQ